MNNATIQLVLKSGVLGTGPLQKAASKCEHVKCASCRYAKARKRNTTSTLTKPTNNAHIRANDVFAGQKISMDHFSVGVKGRLFESRGKTSNDSMYTGGCIFYDHATSYVYIHLQVQINTIEALQAKMSFERHLFDYGIIAQAYHADNGIFNAKEYVKEIEDNFQQIQYSGVGAHHQNGCAERAIGTMFSIARTMMIHAKLRWPDVIDTNIWPMAILYAEWLYNHMPKQNGLAPVELLSRTKVSFGKLQHAHVFGCPVYVLDPKMQNFSMMPKFTPRSRRGIFVGFSRRHSSTVPLVLNLQTLTITPQYHIVFDDWFSSVSSFPNTEIDMETLFSNLFDDSRFKYTFDEKDDVRLHNDWNEATTEQTNQREETRQYTPTNDTETILTPSTTTIIPIATQNNIQSTPTMTTPTFSTSPNLQSPIPNIPSTPMRQITPTKVTFSPTIATPGVIQQTPISSPVIPTPILRRSTRERKQPDRLSLEASHDFFQLAKLATNTEKLVKFCSNLQCNPHIHHTVAYYAASNANFECGTIDYGSPSIYNAIFDNLSGNSTSTTYKLHEAMLLPDWDMFQEAALKEIRTLESMNTWYEIEIEKVPTNKKILGGTWVFKRKSTHNLENPIKYKARFCVRGDQQIAGIDYFETYAPVCMWSTVRLMFTLSLIADLETVQVDYANAFAQAIIKEDVYIHIPQGFQPKTSSLLSLNWLNHCTV